jgi:hypothetical protein
MTPKFGFWMLQWRLRKWLRSEGLASARSHVRGLALGVVSQSHCWKLEKADVKFLAAMCWGIEWFRWKYRWKRLSKRKVEITSISWSIVDCRCSFLERLNITVSWIHCQQFIPEASMMTIAHLDSDRRNWWRNRIRPSVGQALVFCLNELPWSPNLSLAHFHWACWHDR